MHAEIFIGISVTRTGSFNTRIIQNQHQLINSHARLFDKQDFRTWKS